MFNTGIKKISAWRRWVGGLCAMAWMLTSSISQSAGLPSLGDNADGFDVATERRLGEHIMREIWRDPDYIDDPILTAYLQSIWQPLLKAARAQGDISPEIDTRLAWTLFGVRDRSINAFALPGGYVGVHLGLVAMTASPDELASVLGHELSHITQRHIGRSMANARRQSMLGMAAMIVGVLAATRSNRSDGANAVIAGGQALSAQGQLNFSRDMEREADRMGFALLQGAGFAPAGMAAMFEKLEHNARLNDGGGFPYLRSHPLTNERIGQARARLGLQADAIPTTPLTHVIAQARARVLMDPRVIALKRWQALKVNPAAPVAEQLLTSYTNTLACIGLRDWACAQKAYEASQTLARGDEGAQRQVALLGAELALATDQADAALRWLAPYRQASLSEQSRPVLLLAAQAALKPNRAQSRELENCAQALQTWLAQAPLDANAWLSLSQVWQQLDQPLRALRAQVESKAVIGDVNGALDRLREAQRQARASAHADHIEAAVIDARLKALQTRQRQQFEEPQTP